MNEPKPYVWKLRGLSNNSAQWKAFLQMLDDKIDMHLRKLEQSTDMKDVYHAQGALQALRQLKFLRDEINGTDSQ